MNSESEWIPYHAVPVMGTGPALVLAPHPDDEVFGCAGAIMRHVAAGDPVKVLILTDGGGDQDDGPDRAACVERRRQECRNAAAILGYGEPVFWAIRDRELIGDEPLLQRLCEMVIATGARWLYAPSPGENHPDHRRLGMAALEMLRRLPGPITLALYEVSAPLLPNRLLDISSMLERKRQAMACFVSQLATQPYARQIEALNCYRTYTLGNIAAAEAYDVIEQEAAAEAQRFFASMIAGRRRSPNIPALTASEPLVSVIVRTLGRPDLVEALASIATQTHAHLEVVVVDALGADHLHLENRCGPFPLRIVGTGQRLGRSAAANVGLDQADGDYLIFLDDDDWFEPDHIASLVGLLQRDTATVAAYAGVRCIRRSLYGQWETLRIYNDSFDATRLRVENFIPIHALLFRRTVLSSPLPCRFDEQLDLYEDWDFWLQLLERGAFQHRNAVSACYRIHDDGSLVSASEQQLQMGFQSIVRKWRGRWSDRQLMDIMIRARTSEPAIGRIIEPHSTVAEDKVAQPLRITHQFIIDAPAAVDIQALPAPMSHPAPLRTVLVNLIIPVYRGLAETRACLSSVLRSQQSVPHEIIVIDDASPDPALADYLRELAMAGHITLLRNDQNLGFVQTVNRGMALHEERDVMLLNSDAEVAGDWLDRLTQCAYSSPDIGTVTPFSNNATICSYPQTCADNALPPGYTVATLDGLFRRVNSGQSAPIPTAVGFCMYIRRDCLRAVGPFDAAHFGRGYGEENDFCMRAAAVGWRHLLCGDVFVYHWGGASFGAERDLLQQQAIATLRQMHPGYEIAVQAHIAADPAKPLRQAVDAARLLDSQLPVVLFINHNLGGGTLKHVLDLAALLSERIQTLVLFPTVGQTHALCWLREGEKLEFRFTLPADYSLLCDVLRALGVERIHFHHLLNVDSSIWQLPQDLRIPYDYTLHDYYPVCPRINLFNAPGRYCGEPDEAGCNRCLQTTEPVIKDITIQDWRAHYLQLLNAAERVFAPTQDVKKRMLRYMPVANIVFAPHPEARSIDRQPSPATLAAIEPLRIVVLGRLTQAKGADLLEACALDAWQRALPLTYHLLGSAQRNLTVEPNSRLRVYGAYANNDLPMRLAAMNPHLAWFPAQWPETYCYALSACLQAGLPIVATNLGAFPERLAGRSWSWIRSWRTGPAAWNDFFMAVRKRYFAGGISPPVLSGAMPTVDFDYCFDYLQPSVDAPGEPAYISGGLATLFHTCAIIAPPAEQNCTAWLQIGETSRHINDYPDLVNLAGVTPFGDSGINGRIAVHAHIFYLDLAEEIAAHLRHIPFAFDLFVSTTDEAARTTCETIFRNLRQVGRLCVQVTPNQGRDIAPLFCQFGAELSGYDFIAHIHTKKSLYAGGGMVRWREYLLQQLLGSEDQVRRIFALFADDPGLGLVYPQNYRLLPYWGNTWLSNKGLGRQWCQRLGIEHMPEGYFDYPAGSMFWARPAGLRALFDAGILLSDFPEEAGQTDGTLAHCLERLLALTTRRMGLRTAIVADPTFPSWSKWRFDHYLARTRAHVEAMLTSGKLKIIAFDIFDTLVVRPSLQPEIAKQIIATRMAGAPGGADFMRLRPLAEEIARSRTRQDVNLNDIYIEYATLAGLTPEDAGRLQNCEEQVERALVAPRPDGLTLFRYTRATGKPVVLISDMFLSRQTLETLLEEQGIHGYAELYLSSEVGVRKDSGQLYHHVLKQWGLAPDQLLMIGDNEHSDLQIPVNLGIQTAHVLRPIAMAAAVPRFARILERFRQSDVNSQLVLGLVVKRFFHPIFYHHFSPADFIHGGAEGVGYAIVGPLIVAFAQWILAHAKTDRITTLYFLAREGKLLKEVYDRLASTTPNAAAARYLVVSRRAMTVPMIETFDDILSIAGVDYFSNDLAKFLFYRFGLTLDDAERAELARCGRWAMGRKVEVKGNYSHHLQPMLEAIADRIYARAAVERPGLLAYLQQMGLDQPGTSAVVDVGYSATIQGRLSKILGQGLHGYYLLTSAKAQQVCDSYGVLARGCYGESLVPGTGASPLWRYNFQLEMLLSTDDAQVMYYATRPDSAVAPVFQPLSEAEQSASTIRADIRRGVLAFVEDVLALDQAVLPGVRVPCDLAVALYAEFIEGLSAAEGNTMAGLALDDHYCGHGIVTLDPSNPQSSDTGYNTWLQRHQWDDLACRHLLELTQQRAMLPLIHWLIVLPASQSALLGPTLIALARQTLTAWRLTVIADFACPSPEFAQMEELSWVPLSAWEELNEVLAEQARQSPAEWFWCGQAGVQLEPVFINLTVELISRHPQWRLVYTDEDVTGLRQDQEHWSRPLFKPDANLDLLRSSGYVSHAVLIHRALWESLPTAELRPGLLLNYAAALRCFEQFGEAGMGHVDEMVFHRPETAPVDWPAFGRDALPLLREHLQRQNLPATVSAGPLPGTFQVNYRLTQTPLVSIIIPTRNRLDLIQACLDSLLAGTRYPRFEVLVMDNRSDEPAVLDYLQTQAGRDARVRVIPYPAEYNYSAINNHAARLAQGEFLLLLNNDTVVLQEDWLEILVAIGLRSDVGAVGCRLVFPNYAVQHAGVMVGLGGVADHIGVGLPLGKPGYMGRAQLSQNFSAVTAACLLARRQTFFEVGGLDERDFPVLFNDVDFCLKLGARGYRIVWTPAVTLIHHGSSTLRADADADADAGRLARHRRQQFALVEKWRAHLIHDPAYNRHLSLRNRHWRLDDAMDGPWHPEFDPLPRVVAIPCDAAGVGHYRTHGPVSELTRQGRIRSLLLPDGQNPQGFMPEPIELSRIKAQVLLVQNAFTERQLSALEVYAQLSPDVFRIFGLDDLVFALPAQNPARQHLGRDIKTRLRRGLARCDRAVVTSEPLAKALRGMIADVRVVPNYLDRARWTGLAIPHREHRKPRVGWAGGIHHAGDLAVLQPVIEATAAEVDWVFMGLCPDTARPYVAEVHPGVSFDAYPAALAALDLDLAVAPLELNRFNQAKSNLRLLEYGVLGWPVVCTDILPYQNAPVTRTPNNPAAWIRAIREQVNDPEASRAVGARLRNWVLDCWMLDQHLEEWLSALLPDMNND